MKGWSEGGDVEEKKKGTMGKNTVQEMKDSEAGAEFSGEGENGGRRSSNQQTEMDLLILYFHFHFRLHFISLHSFISAKL